ncbi:MAG: hypothetical protein ACOY0S_01235 [Patescibacteria group bacterium]
MLSLLVALPVQAGPTSTNYELEGYAFGAGGSSNSTSPNYNVLGVMGETDTGKTQSTNFKAEAGLVYTMAANVPPAPAFTNPSNYYNKLNLIINQGGNPSDAKYAIAISTDNFVADIKYVQNDNTVGTTLGLEDWQTYASWGGASGTNIIGLVDGTTYYVKAAAKQGNFTETGFGPVASASTVNPNITFDIDVSATDSETDPPFAISFSDLLLGSVIDSPQKVWVDLATNGESGGKVYVYGQNGGLLSSVRSYTITSVTGNLSSLSEGFGAQGTSATQTSGGPLVMESPYNGSAENVGVTDTNIREIFTSANPITGGRGSFLLKAKSSSVTPVSDDYSETLRVIASAAF